MKEWVGLARLCAVPGFDHLRAVAAENPRELIPQAKQFLACRRPDPGTEARVYHLMCHVSAGVLRRSTVEAVFHGHEAVRLARQREGPEGQALLFDSLMALGAAALRVGEYGRAIGALREALGLPLEWIGRKGRERAALTLLGDAYYYRTDRAEALAAYDQAALLAGEAGDLPAEVHLHLRRAQVMLKEDDAEEAGLYLELAAEAASEQAPDRLVPKGLILAWMAVQQAQSRDWQAAEELARGAAEIGQATGEAEIACLTAMALALVSQARRRVEEALQRARGAMDTAFAHGHVPLLQEVIWLMNCMERLRR